MELACKKTYYGVGFVPPLEQTHRTAPEGGRVGPPKSALLVRSPISNKNVSQLRFFGFSFHWQHS